ncbi:MAG: LPS assembly lipoprotein LptE [Bdellovibrionales bacterium]|nr:LPS assembly lipoprotein LptE [Bdellovibrionales bacterium]
MGIKFLQLLPLLCFLWGCAYEVGYQKRALLGNYKQVAIPVFENKSQITGPEKYFTSTLIKEFERIQTVNVTSKSKAPVFIKGSINEVTVEGLSPIQGGAEPFDRLPKEAALYSVYRIKVRLAIAVLRRDDQVVLWSENFNREKVYKAPQIESPIINSANAVYNESAIQSSLSEVADELMTDVYDRLTESF